MDSWSYADEAASADGPDPEEKPSPQEVIHRLKRHKTDGDRYWAAITGRYRPQFDDPVKATAYLVRGIKKATHETGSRPPAVMETLAYIAEKWPKEGPYNLPRWWARETLGNKFRDAHYFVFSEQTDPDTFFEDPRPKWYKEQQSEDADRHEAQVKAAFWDCVQDAEGGVVFAHPSDIAAHPDVEIGERRIWNILHDWQDVKDVQDPYDDTRGGIKSRKVFAVCERR